MEIDSTTGEWRGNFVINAVAPKSRKKKDDHENFDEKAKARRAVEAKREELAFERDFNYLELGDD